MREEETARKIGAAIRAARKAAGLSQADLGAFVGDLDRHVIAAIERGELTLQVRRLLQLLDAVGLALAVQPAARAHQQEESEGLEERPPSSSSGRPVR